MRRIYLDHNATTPVDPEVFEAMRPYLTDQYGNASSIHGYGQMAKAAVEDARECVAQLLNAQPGEIFFTSGGTESDNTAIFGAVEAARERKAGAAVHVITTSIEHHAVLHAAQAIEARGVRVTYVPVGIDGVIDAADVERAIAADTVLISVMHANNEIGTIQPVREIGRIARERGITFHSDAVQSVGKIPVDVRAIGLDLLSLSAHKIEGPKGVGALYVRKGTVLRPLMYGGHHERDRRPGTENVPGIAGLGKAAELAAERMSADAARIAPLRDRLEAEILRRLPRVKVNGSQSPRLPNTSSLMFENVDGEGLVIGCDLRGLACSTGAACSSGSLESSHVLTAIGLNRDQTRSTMRVSLGRTTTPEDVEAAIGVVVEVVERLRSLSPHEHGEATRVQSSTAR
ncbi:MAG: cysteine desulfurase family protein [Terriglobia bacterium]